MRLGANGRAYDLAGAADGSGLRGGVVVYGLRLETMVSATILKFSPKSRSGDPDFPGIPVLAAHYRKPIIPADDLVMDHVDTAPSGWVAPEQDGA